MGEAEEATRSEAPVTGAPGERRDDTTFWNGVMAGVALALVAFNAWMAVGLADMPSTLHDMGAQLTISTLTRIVISVPWRWGVPLVGAVVLALIIARRPRKTGPYAIVMVAMLWTAAGTWYYSQAPMRELAEELKE